MDDYRTNRTPSELKELKDAEKALEKALNEVYSDSKEIWGRWIESLRDRIDEHRTQAYRLNVNRKITVGKLKESREGRQVIENKRVSIKEFLCREYSNLLFVIDRVKDSWVSEEINRYLSYMQRQVRNFKEWPFEYEKKLREHIQMYMTDAKELLRALEWKDFIYRACYDNATFIYVFDLEKVGSFC
mgnify:CR=1 FL=1